MTFSTRVPAYAALITTVDEVTGSDAKVLQKNRYVDILPSASSLFRESYVSVYSPHGHKVRRIFTCIPVDSTRVKLNAPGASDYINANHLPGVEV